MVLTLPLLPKYPIVSLFTTRDNLRLSVLATHFTLFAHGVLKGICVVTVWVSTICLPESLAQWLWEKTSLHHPCLDLTVKYFIIYSFVHNNIIKGKSKPFFIERLLCNMCSVGFW